jgi:hypothetical protein
MIGRRERLFLGATAQRKPQMLELRDELPILG